MLLWFCRFFLVQYIDEIRPSIEITKVKNIMVDAIPLTTIHATMSDVGNCELKEEINEDTSVYTYEIIGWREAITLGSSKDEDELVKDIYSWKIKRIKCGLSEISLAFY